MEVQPELSLGPAALAGGFSQSGGKISSSESDSSGVGAAAKKRKYFAGWEEAVSHASLELQLSDPLPLDWEQCLDLHSGRMYYLNRKTMKKSWTRPRDQQLGGALDLELNISTIPSSLADGNASSFSFAAGADDAAAAAAAKSIMSGIGSAAGQYMVAVPCANCHLLVMLSMSSPECPNCKFVQPSSLPAAATPPPPPRRLDAVKPQLETLSLLH